MALGSRDMEQELRDFARLQVRADLSSSAQQRADVAEAIAAELGGVDADVLARAWLAAAANEWRADAAKWQRPTDHERLQSAFAVLAAAGVPVLQGVFDHWTAQTELDRLAADGAVPRGIAWFTSSDVWHAIDHGMLELNVWHGDSANVAPGDPLLAEVLAVLSDHGLSGHFDEGRIEISAHWHALPG
jgi:hypothetical protein